MIFGNMGNMGEMIKMARDMQGQLKKVKEELSQEMFEETVDPFIEELGKFRNRSMNVEAMTYCMGILKGIYDFHKESASEYKDWAVDAPGEYFSMVLHDWKKSTKKRKDLAEMNEFTDKNCPDWAASRRKKRC